MGDGINTPFTRADVEKLIAANGGTTDKLDLSKRIFEEGIDLRGINNGHFFGIILNEAVLEKAHLENLLFTGAQLKSAFLDGAFLDGARFSGANLEYANLPQAHLRGTRLTHAHLEGAEFFDADLQNAELIETFLYKTRLSSAHLQGCNFHGAKFDNSTRMETIDWGNYQIANEIEGKFDWAKDTYRQLKIWYSSAGLYDTASIFYYREMECQRKSYKWRSKNFRHRLSMSLSYIYWGYGQGWKRLFFGWGLGSIFIFAFVYFVLKGVSPFCLNWDGFLNGLNFSAVSFIGIGGSPWFAKDITETAQIFGIIESIWGFFSMTLFVAAFIRNWAH